MNYSDDEEEEEEKETQMVPEEVAPKPEKPKFASAIKKKRKPASTVHRMKTTKPKEQTFCDSQQHKLYSLKRQT